MNCDSATGVGYKQDFKQVYWQRWLLPVYPAGAALLGMEEAGQRTRCCFEQPPSSKCDMNDKKPERLLLLLVAVS